jgi:hypothetical protein
MAFNQGDLKAMLIKVFIILVRLIGFSDDITLISSRTSLQGFTSSFVASGIGGFYLSLRDNGL